jgi:hypothetical protein
MNLMKNQFIQKFQYPEILKERATRLRIHFKNHLIKKICLIGSKCLTFDVGQCEGNNHVKN